jgi:hypothetical protein
VIDGQSLDLDQLGFERFELTVVEIEFELQPSIRKASFDQQ